MFVGADADMDADKCSYSLNAPSFCKYTDTDADTDADRSNYSPYISLLRNPQWGLVSCISLKTNFSAVLPNSSIATKNDSISSC